MAAYKKRFGSKAKGGEPERPVDKPETGPGDRRGPLKPMPKRISAIRKA